MKRYDVWTRFARAHLSRPEERATYFTLVGHPGRSWTPEQVATATALSEEEARRVLGGYADAGIVDRSETPQGDFYRWRSEMDYLFAPDEPSFGSVDPVCGMPVTADSPYSTRNAFGREHRFCAALCLAAFRAFPSAFLTPPEIVR